MNPFLVFNKSDLALALKFRAVMISSPLCDEAMLAIQKENISPFLQMTTYEKEEKYKSSRLAFKLIEDEKSFNQCLAAYLLKETL